MENITKERQIKSLRDHLVQSFVLYMDFVNSDKDDVKRNIEEFKSALLEFEAEQNLNNE